MNDSLHALLESSIDYAGLFPPASLDMETSVRNFADYHQSAESWLLGRFVCPVSRLDEVLELMDLLPATGCALSALGSPEQEMNGSSLVADIEKLAAFDSKYAPIQFASIEIKLPKGCSEKSTGLNEFLVLADNAATAMRYDGRGFRMYLEVPASLAELVSDRIQLGRCQNIGLKIRTGGEGVDISAAQLASFVATCATSSAFFKATAGLHDPLSHHSDGHWECGFLNLFVASVLARQYLLNAEQIGEILTEETLDSISIQPDKICWRDCQMINREIIEARRNAIISFGSCSFADPVNGLQRLGLL